MALRTDLFKTVLASNRESLMCKVFASSATSPKNQRGAFVPIPEHRRAITRLNTLRLKFVHPKLLRIPLFALVSRPIVKSEIAMPNLYPVKSFRELVHAQGSGVETATM